MHLPAVIDQDDQVIAQLRIPGKTHGIPCLREIVGPLDSEGAWASADALHTQTETARFLVEDKNAHYLLTAKLNQPTLYASCGALPATVAAFIAFVTFGRLLRGRQLNSRPAPGRRARPSSDPLRCSARCVRRSRSFSEWHWPTPWRCGWSGPSSIAA
ncbi:transposase [Streptomyces clavifer]|uniref:transposase n=1 Tax=Streptomyces clavifer TaxID=68188 RepID=UPI003692E592